MSEAPPSAETVASPQGLKARLRDVLTPSQNAFLARVLLGLAVFAFALVGGAGYMLKRLHAPVTAKHGSVGEEHAEAEHGEGEDKGEGAVARLLQANQVFPREVLKRQDGRPEADNDLFDPQISESRGVASLLRSSQPAQAPFRFVELEEIFSGTKPSGSGDGNVTTRIFIEVDSIEARNETLKRQSEFRAVIASLISERTRESLLEFEGISALKADVQRELNHKLKQGRVVDVLFSSFFVK